MQPTMTRVTVPGEVTLTAYQSGKGPDVMLLHGITGCASYWDDQTARLVAAGYRVTAVDGRGHGVSDRASDYHTATLAADAAAVIRALGLVKPTVIGHSMGGAQTLRLAVDYPELVGGIVLEDPAIWPVAADDERLATIRDPWRQQLEAWVPMAQQALENFKRSETPHWTAAAITAWAYAKKTNDPNVLQWLDELKTPVWQWLKAVPVPMLLLYCEPERGGVVNAEFVAALCAAMPTMRSMVIPAVGHEMHHDAPDAFWAAVQTALPSAVGAR